MILVGIQSPATAERPEHGGPSKKETSMRHPEPWNRRARPASIIVMMGFPVLFTLGCEKGAFAPKKVPDARLAGVFEPGLISDHAFVVTVWHQTAGTLHNGILSIEVKGLSGEPLKYDAVHRHEWSFDAWAPNQESAQVVRIPLRDDMNALELKLAVKVHLKAEGFSNYETVAHCVDNDWSSNRRAQPETETQPSAR
jgi:hypothetical protein